MSRVEIIREHSGTEGYAEDLAVARRDVSFSSEITSLFVPSVWRCVDRVEVRPESKGDRERKGAVLLPVRTNLHLQAKNLVSGILQDPSDAVDVGRSSIENFEILL